jgi:hypothetical protein
MSSATLKIKIFDAKGTQAIPIARSTATVGSAPHCDVVLSHPGVQAEHARAWCEGGRIWVQDLGTVLGTTLNGIRLPPLKPMLVRELDIVKLGDCPSTMGLEPNLVRAPVFKPNSALSEITNTDIRPLVSPDASIEKRDEEFERMHRELADLKLQIQMAHLEKDASVDLRKELAALKEEFARVNAEKEKLKESFTHFDGDKKNFKLQLENEVAELKLKALRELKEQREEDSRKFEKWKNEAAGQLTVATRGLAEQKGKVWNQRPLSKDMLLEFDSELASIVRRVILKESSVPPVGTSKMTEPTSSSPPKPPVPQIIERRKRPRTSNDGPWQRIAVGGFVLALFMAVAFYASTYLKRDGARTMASQIETAPRPAVGLPAVPVVKPINPEAGKTPGFKKSYTDNVLLTSNYVDAELNMDFRSLWIKDLSRAATKEWKLDAKTVTEIASKEIVLIQELSRLKGTPTQMRQLESQFMKELQQQLGKKVTTEKFMRLKRTFYTRNQVYLTRETR